MKTLELEPCPFCDGAAKIIDRGDGEWCFRWVVKCGNESCFVQPWVSDKRTRIGAIRKWNTRKGVSNV